MNYYAKMFFIWWTEFLTTDYFADYYNLSKDEAEYIINRGRKEYNLYCDKER